MITTEYTAPRWSQEPGASSWSLTQVAGSQRLRPFSMDFPNGMPSLQAIAKPSVQQAGPSNSFSCHLVTIFTLRHLGNNTCNHTCIYTAGGPVSFMELVSACHVWKNLTHHDFNLFYDTPTIDGRCFEIVHNSCTFCVGWLIGSLGFHWGASTKEATSSIFVMLLHWDGLLAFYISICIT